MPLPPPSQPLPPPPPLERNSKPAIRSYPKFVPDRAPLPSSPLFLSADETFQLLICDMHEMLETMTQA